MALATQPTYNLTDDVWLGTEASYQVVKLAIEKLSDSEATLITAPRVQASDVSAVDELGLPKLLQQQGDIGVLTVDGPMVPGNAGFMRLFGVVGYADIQDALIEAVSNPEIKGIVLNADSGGGAVNGLQDTADMLAAVDAVKPVVAYTGSMMASAMYWLGTSSRHVMLADTGELGSIGVLTVLMERSKQLADAGINVKVVRGGKFKALSNPYEPMSDKAVEMAQEKVDALHGLFKAHVADRMGLSSAQIDKVGQGQMYLGAAAVSAGLAHSVGNFAAAATLVRSEASKTANVRTSRALPVDKGSSRAENASTQGTQDMVLTPAQIAALASGTPMAEVLKMVPTMASATEEKPVAAVEAATEAAAEEKPAAATEAAAEEKPAADTETVALLKAQLSEAQEALVDAKAELKMLTKAHEATAASMTGLCEIVRKSVANMAVACNMATNSADGLSGAELLAEHTRVTGIFTSKFPVGGVAAISPESKPETKPVQHSPLLATLVASVPAQ